MKIGVIAHLKHAIRQPFAGGLEMHTWLLCRQLLKRGHDVTLFAAKGSDSLGLEVLCEEMHDAHDGFAVEHAVYLGLMRSLQGRAFDVIHNNSLHYLSVAMAASVPIPMVTTLHTPPFWELEGSMRLTETPHHCYVAVSDAIRDSWARITPVARVVTNGIDLHGFAYQAAADLDRHGIWYGRIVPEKGLHLAIDAARSVGLPLHFAGPIWDGAYYDTEIVPRMHEGTTYLGHLSHADLAVAVGAASVFLCTPMWDEPYGLVVAEALACGTPVAAFARGAIPELLDSTCGVLAPPGDWAALAAAAVQAQALQRRSCRTRAEKVANVENMMDVYESVYEAMIRKHPRPLQARNRNVDILTTDADNASLIDLYSRKLATMVCELPCLV